MRNGRGQIMVVAIILLALLAALVPVLVASVQDEERWSLKQGQNANAEQLAEAALERGFAKVVESTNTFAAVQAGGSLSGFLFDAAYTDLPGGKYAVAVTSGPGSYQVTVQGIGMDVKRKEVRGLKAVYGDSTLAGVAVIAAKGVAMTGSNSDIEWGAVTSPNSITIGGKIHPSFWSGGSVDLDANAALPPNCDAPNCWWWHSYYSGVPPVPLIDFNFYKSSAQASGTSPCGLAYYQSGNVNGACSDHTGRTFYVEGNWTNFNGDILGNVVTLGSLSFRTGILTTLPSYAAPVPSLAWMQYCDDWAFYKATYDPGSPYSSCPSPSAGYAPQGLTKVISPAIHGFLYVGGDLSLPNGGGNSDILHGVIIVQGNANINTNSNGHIYADSSIAENLVTTKIILMRQSWQDLVAR